MAIQNQRQEKRANQEVLTPRDVADRLQMNERTVIRYFANGTLPGKKIGSQWRMLATNLDSFLSQA